MNDQTSFVDDLMVRCADVLSKLREDEILGSHVDASLAVPRPFQGRSEIRLIVVGQDPTVEEAETRNRITTVLMLDEERSNLRRFIQTICNRLGLSLDEHVYATNVCKNFFMQRPEAVTDPDLIGLSWKMWQGVLQDEVNQFPKAAIVTLGKPVLKVLLKHGHPHDLKHYWGHVDGWKQRGRDSFRAVEKEQSTIDRKFFPLPHVTNCTTTEFYRGNLDDYLAFIRASTERQAA